MDKKTTGIIATIAAVILCGCPGLVGLCFGAASAVAATIPGAEIDIFGNNDPGSAITLGIIVLCVSVLLIAIPVVVGFFTLRNKPEVAAEPVSDEPLPPAI